MWDIGETVHIGWPDFGRPPLPCQVTDLERRGPVIRARVRDDQGKEGGYLVAYGYPYTVLEKVAGEATGLLGFSVTLPPLRCSINGAILRSFDYEWWPTPEYADRPRLVLDTIADLLGVTNNRSGP